MNLKEHKKKLIISSIVILLPILFGLFIWDQLPDMMTTHWGVDNQPDGWGSKSFAVFVMPLLQLGMHWLCLWITSIDRSQKKQSKKVITLIFWLVPMISLFSSAMMYGIALGNSVSMTSILFIMIGLMFVVIGNYLPKTKQNHHIGIKVVWTLNNEENWNATHRFTGKVWVIGGVIMALAAFLPPKYGFAAMLPGILLFGAAPMLYSYLYYKKQCREGRGYSLHVSQQDQKIFRISMVFVILILIFVAVLMFSGNIRLEFYDTGFTIDASYYDDLTVEYAAIESIELRSEPISGTRIFGYASARLLLGMFENEEFGGYTRYTYTGSPTAIVIHAKNKILVLAGRTEEETESFYQTLLSKIN